MATDLTAADRCDRCGARAAHRFMFGQLDLLLCHHHYVEHEDRLPQQIPATSGQAGE